MSAVRNGLRFGTVFTLGGFGAYLYDGNYLVVWVLVIALAAVIDSVMAP